jgi:hypothetical protein
MAVKTAFDAIPQGGIGLPQIGWPGFLDLGPFFWPIAAVVAVPVALIAAITIGPKYGVMYTDPPIGYAAAINTALLPKREERPKKDPFTGKIVMKTITEDGQLKEIPDTEFVWVTKGRYSGAVVNLNGFHVDRHGYISENDTEYDKKTGKNVKIAADTKDKKSDKKLKDKKQANKNPVNQFLADKYSLFYLGNYWLMNRAAKHYVYWWTRPKLDEPAIKRSLWERFIRITRVSTALDIVSDPLLEDIAGFPWKGQFTIQYRIRHLGKAWVEIPDSDDQMIQLIRSAITQYWQENFILRYEGIQKKAPGKKHVLAPIDHLKKKKIEVANNNLLGERLLVYLKETGVWLRILNELGREVDIITVDDKTLFGEYADLVAGVGKAELRKRITEIDAAATKNKLITEAEGKDAWLWAHEKHGAHGLALLLRPEGGVSSETSLGDVALSQVVAPTIGEALRKTKTAEQGKNENKTPVSKFKRRQGGNKKI